MNDAAEIAREAAPPGHSRLQWRILIGFVLGLVLGLATYSLAGEAAWVDTVTTYVTGPIGQIFLRLLFMLVIPLLFSALVVGIAEMGEIRALRRVGIRTLVYTLVVSAIAVAVSLAAVNILRPGDGVDPVAAQQLLAQGADNAKGILAKSHEAAGGVESFPEDVRVRVGGMVREMEALGFEGPVVCRRIDDVLHATETYLVTMRAGSGSVNHR